MVRPFIADQYASLSYKKSVLPPTGRPPTAPSWVDDVDARRLAAYDILGAFRTNTAANFLPEPDMKTVREIVQADLLAGTIVEEPDYRDKIREYGHGHLAVVSGRALLLGEDQSLELDGTDVPDDAADVDKQAAARAQQFADWLDAWAEDAALIEVLFDVEENCVGDGDGVLALGWDPEVGAPTVDKYDPGFYFPDLTGRRGPWRNAVHVAWEEKDGPRTVVRRQTWRLVDVEDWRPKYWAEPMPPSTKQCVYSEAIYDLAKFREGYTVYTLPDDLAEWVTANDTGGHELLLPVDFLPVVHIPNTPNGEGHFGRALPLLVAQILDDLMLTDTDLQSGSANAGSPPLATKGMPAGNIAGGPGAHWNLPDTGDARYVDTSRNLDALLKYHEHLLALYSVNSRLAASLLGHIKPSEVPSGYAFELGFAATSSLVGEMRLVRRSKHRLLLKFVMRIGQAYEVLPAGATPVGRIVLGAFLPADKSAAADRVAKLLPVHAMSVRTAVAELVESGYAVDEAEAEVERILAEWVTLAVGVVDATGDVAAARHLLGLDAAPQPPAPALPTPGPGPVPAPPAG